jgi:hypothetical protein
VQEWFRLNGPIQHLEEAEVVRDGCIERRAADVDPGRLGRIVGPGEWVELDLPGIRDGLRNVCFAPAAKYGADQARALEAVR